MVAVAIIGCGFMGTALLETWLKRSIAQTRGDEYTFAACVRSEQSLKRLQNQIRSIQGASCNLGSGDEAAVRMAGQAAIVLLGCAPSDLKTVLHIEGMVDNLQGKIIISLLAGVSYENLTESWTSNGGIAGDVHFVRALPTLGARIGESATLIVDSPAHQAEKSHMQTAESLFAEVGTVEHVTEKLMSEATALGAVCHALVIVAADTMADASAADGLPRPVALSIIAQCMRGANGLLQSGMSPEEMKNAMAIPTGITINSILQLERSARSGIADSLRYAVAHTKRMAA